MFDWTKSAYLRFTADKLAEMKGEVGADPVNNPEEIYRRYGNGEQITSHTAYKYTPDNPLKSASEKVLHR